MPKRTKKNKNIIKTQNKFLIKFKKISSQKKDFFKKHFILRIIYSIFIIILSLYILIFVGARHLEGVATFPGVMLNTLEYTQDPVVQARFDFDDINIDVDGKNLNGLYLDNSAEKTIYFFHGNGGELVLFYNRIKLLSDLGYNVLAIDYPGYGKSTGFPHERNIQKYADTLYAYAQDTYRLKDENTIIWGYSIGTGVALDFTERSGKNFSKIILEAAYTSRYGLSEYNYGLTFQKFFFKKNSFVSIENIKNNTIPTLLLHGHKDHLVPFYMGKELYEVSNKEITSFIEIPEGTHYNLLESEFILDTIKKFLSPESRKSFYEKVSKDDFAEYLREKALRDFDLVSDASLTKYVDPNVPFTQLSYIPEDLISLEKEYIIDTKGNAQMREEAAKKLSEMAEKFYTDMGEKMVAVSTYRSYAYQAGIKSRGCPDNLCAKAGYSEHQGGLAVDFWSASTKSYWDNSERLTKFYNWLYENAHLYGYHNTYQNGLEIDGYEIEPWHWRYVGEKLALHLWENEITFSEFYSEYGVK